jgi:hypothetical protein
VNCFLLLGNEHLSTSRKDCGRFKELLTKDADFFSKRSLMLTNASSTAALEAWPGQSAKEREKANEAKEGVTSLKEEVLKLKVPQIQVLELSNQIISEIFYKLITVCKGTTGKAK